MPFFENKLKLVKENEFILGLIAELRKEKYESIREEIITTSIFFLNELALKNPSKHKYIYLFLIEFISYPYSFQNIQEIKEEILSRFSIKQHGYNIAKYTPSIILYHFPHIPSQY